MENPNIPAEAKNLDRILEKCRWRFDNHYHIGEWDNLAKDIVGGDSKNPLFEAYIEELKEEKLIKDARKNEGSGDGCIATLKGLMFKGYEKTIIDSASEKIEVEKLRVKEKDADFSRTIKTVIISGCIGLLGGLLTTTIQLAWQKDTILNPVVLPKIQIAHDTTRADAYSYAPDTALVRIVKRK